MTSPAPHRWRLARLGPRWLVGLVLPAALVAGVLVAAPASAAGTLTISYSPTSPTTSSAITLTATVTGCGAGNTSVPSLYYLVSGPTSENGYYTGTTLSDGGNVATASITFPSGTFSPGSYSIYAYGRGTPCFASSFNYTSSSTVSLSLAAATVPGPPTGPEATAGDGQATVSWTAPASDGGATVSSYTVSASPGGASCTWSSGPLECTVSGLTNGTPYTFTVTATNTVGTGAASGPSSPATPATVPGPPTGPEATAGDGQATVSWTAPASDGGATVSSYTVSASPGGASCTWSSGPLECTVSGLTNGTPYTFAVTATNTVGTGAASSPSSPATPATVAPTTTSGASGATTTTTTTTTTTATATPTASTAPVTTTTAPSASGPSAPRTLADQRAPNLLVGRSVEPMDVSGPYVPVVVTCDRDECRGAASVSVARRPLAAGAPWRHLVLARAGFDLSRRERVTLRLKVTALGKAILPVRVPYCAQESGRYRMTLTARVRGRGRPSSRSTSGHARCTGAEPRATGQTTRSTKSAEGRSPSSAPGRSWRPRALDWRHDVLRSFSAGERGLPAVTRARRLQVALGVDLGLVLAEAVGGGFSHSTALLADAGHNLADAAALVLALVAVRLAHRSPTAVRSFGYHRATIVAAVANVAALLLVTVVVVLAGIERILHPVHVDAGTLVAVAALAVVGNGFAGLVLVDRSRDLNLRVAALHLLGDALAGLGVLAAGLVILLTGRHDLLDPVVSLGVACLVAVEAVRVGRESIDVLLEAAPPDLDPWSSPGRSSPWRGWPRCTTCTAGASRARSAPSRPISW